MQPNQYRPSLNPYKIWWISYMPISGIVTKRDRRLMGAITGDKSEAMSHHGSKASAETHIEMLRGKLSKPYIAVMYTDKQFGRRDMTKSPLAVLTRKQLSETIILK